MKITICGWSTNESLSRWSGHPIDVTQAVGCYRPRPTSNAVSIGCDLQESSVVERQVSSMGSPAAAALETRDDLLSYGRGNAIILFALQLRFSIDDIDAVAAASVTDGSNDKKCDVVYVDRGEGRVVVAQGYATNRSSGQEAPANKASDLNTGVNWLLAADLDTLPEQLQSAAIEVRSALQAGEISDFQIWYCHNMKESKNVAAELNQVVAAADSLLKRYFPAANLAVSAEEIGKSKLEDIYSRSGSTILVTDEFVLDVDGGFEANGSDWSAFCTSVNGRWLQQLWRDHQADLTSPNVREYLGIVRTEANINNGMKSTATREPDRFWIYNNGLTILVNDYQVNRRKNGWKLKISGIGIVNGAQTTGSIGTLLEGQSERLDDLQIMARFVRCQNAQVLSDIVKYNNTQNKVEAADFRSKDQTQDRLRAEFDEIPDADYRGGRRGGVRDAISRRKFLLPDRAVAQCLAAFHGKPNLAYNQTRRIWEENKVYAETFSDQVSARHIVFAYSLMRAIEDKKKELVLLPAEGRTQHQDRQLEYLRRRGSITLFVSAVAECLETILDAPLPNRYQLRFRANLSPAEGMLHWRKLLNSLFPFVNQLSGAVDNNLQRQDRVTGALGLFQSMVESTVEANRAQFTQFAKLVATT
ncbi:AIPR family protein [Amycolatopsis sp. lyj-346]|uniref:AIPR family protein n=1 Tax=Amycolatopsis sp. lyj-346 TaxID=2789289 RepID=UPI003978E250